MVVTAVVGSTVVGAAASSSAAKKGAKAQQHAADTSAAESARQYDQSREDMIAQREQERRDSEPWRVAGQNAIGRISSGMGVGGEFNRDFTMQDFVQDPGYGFRFGEGQRAIEGSAASRGMLLSGGTLKALTRYGQDMGSQEYGNAYARFNNNITQRFNRLSSIAGTGQTATQNSNQAGMNASQNMAQMGAANVATGNEARYQGANAYAAGQMGQANAWTGAMNNGINGYMTLRAMGDLFAPPMSGTPIVGAPYSGGMVPIA